MNKVTPAVIEKLASSQKEGVLSIYLPTHRYPTPPHMQEDQTRFKNLLRQAREEWVSEANEDRASDILKQLEAKIEDVDFWKDMREGMAIFANTDGFETYHMPIECEERVSVNDFYDIAPLLVLLSYNQPYYLLALAKHDPRIFRGDIYGLEPLTTELPKSAEDALNIDEMFTNSNTVRGNEGPGHGSNVSSPHGQGDSHQAGTEERLKFFRIIDATILDSNEFDSKLPVLVAATDSEATDFINLSKIPKILQKHAPGSHNTTSLQDLHAIAWPMVQEEVVTKRAEEIVEELHEKEGVQKSSHDIQDITQATTVGRVQTLLIGLTRKTADTISDSRLTNIPILSFAQDHDYEKIAELSKKVLAQGGTILGVGRELLPAKVPVAAIYRY